MDQLPRLGKRELICLLLFTCNYVISVGEDSSFSGCFGWATFFYCGTPLAFHIIIRRPSESRRCLRVDSIVWAERWCLLAMCCCGVAARRSIDSFSRSV